MKAKSRFANVMREAIDAASRANTPKGVGLEAGVLRKTEVPRTKEQISPIKEENVNHRMRPSTMLVKKSSVESMDGIA